MGVSSCCRVSALSYAAGRYRQFGSGLRFRADPDVL